MVDTFALRSAAECNADCNKNIASWVDFLFLVLKIKDFRRNTDDCDPLESLTYEISLDKKISRNTMFLTK